MNDSPKIPDLPEILALLDEIYYFLPMSEASDLQMLMPALHQFIQQVLRFHCVDRDVLTALKGFLTRKRREVIHGLLT